MTLSHGLLEKINFPVLLATPSSRCVMPTFTTRHISCLILSLPVILVHIWTLFFSDVWGLAIDSFGNKKYYVSPIDDFSKFTWIYLLRHRSEVFTFFQEFECMVERMFNRKIVAVRSDWGGEYERLNSFFAPLVLPTWSLASMLTSKMVPPSTSTVT
jgi:hypothetical protein